MPSLLNIDSCEIRPEKESPTYKASIRNFIIELVKRCDIQYQDPGHSIADIEALCIAEASAKGYLGGDDAVLRRSITGGATMAATAYSHLCDASSKIYIALYTAFFLSLDDAASSHIDAVREFASRFVNRQPQQLKLLDDYAALLLEMSQFFNPLAYNMILTSTLDYVSSLIMQCDVLGIPLPASATEYPIFFRRLSGLGNAYTAFIFPASIPVHSWLYALPDIAYHIGTFNDIFSFYKEDLAGDLEDSLVGLIARSRNISVYESLDAVANETVTVHKRALHSLEPFPDAYSAYCSFVQGYYSFHVETKRYKLRDLGL